jgi:hypothetical protein
MVMLNASAKGESLKALKIWRMREQAYLGPVERMM